VNIIVVQADVCNPDTGVPEKADTDTFLVTWDANQDLVRGFALDIILSDPCDDAAADPVIQSVTVMDGNYWVHPGSIDINDDTGDIDGYGSVVCSNSYAGTKDGTDTNAVTVELASLYVGSANAPEPNGTLLQVVVSDNCVIDLKNNSIRGGIIMESGASGSSLQGNTPLNLYTHTDIAEWRKVGKPKCWCRGLNARQCRGDLDGRGQGIKKNIWVSTWDTPVFRTAYGKTEAQLGCPDNHVTYQTGGGDTVALICADLEHTGQGIKKDIRVSTKDTPIFRAWYGIAGWDPNCP
jgi:hypothetical protein